MQVVAGLNLNSMKPRVWDKTSDYYLPSLQAVMVSYADFHRKPKHRKLAIEKGIREYLGVPEHIKVYLDNGAFYFIKRGGEIPRIDYEEFVNKAQPDWFPIPQEFIPTPKMTLEEQKDCFTRTMEINIAYQEEDSYIPIVHISQFLKEYITQLKKNKNIMAKSGLAIGGIVPNLLRAPKAVSHQIMLDALLHLCEEFKEKKIHVFGIGGTATLHIATLLRVNSVDSSGWRNRAARGLIQLPGTGERIVANLGSWRGRKLLPDELEKLKKCQCPACKKYGLDGLTKNRVEGFCNRATHNLWILLEEVRMIEENFLSNNYKEWYKEHLDNTIYRPLIDKLIEKTL